MHWILSLHKTEIGHWNKIKISPNCYWISYDYWLKVTSALFPPSWLEVVFFNYYPRLTKWYKIFIYKKWSTLTHSHTPGVILECKIWYNVQKILLLQCIQQFYLKFISTRKKNHQLKFDIVPLFNLEIFKQTQVYKERSCLK